MAVAHIHFGAGALGLGLVVPAFADRVASVSVFNRPSVDGATRLSLISARGGYWVDVFSGTDSTQSWIPIHYAHEYEALAKHCDDVFSGASAALLTTALKRNGIEASLNELACVCAIAQSKAIPVLILAAENQVDSLWVLRRVSELLRDGQGVFQVRCVVDRICNKPYAAQMHGQEQGLFVFVENFARIYINGADLHSLPAALSDWVLSDGMLRLENLFEFRNDFDFVVNRKKWVVNASHLLLAIYAHWGRYPTINNFAKDFPEIVDRIVDDVAKVSSGLLFAEGVGSRHENDSFVRQLKSRLGRFPQVPYDAVTRLTGPDKLFDFFEDFHRKIAEPFLSSSVTDMNNDDAPILPSYITMCAIDLIAKNRWIRPRPP
jgi:hypothetical protein